MKNGMEVPKNLKIELTYDPAIPLQGICVHAKQLQLCLFVTPWTVAHQAPLSMGFSGKNS